MAMDITYDDESQIKRVVLAAALESGGATEITLVRSQDGIITADRDVPEKVIKTGYVSGPSAPYLVDFVTTIRMPEGWHLGVILENMTGSTVELNTSLLTLYRAI